MISVALRQQLERLGPVAEDEPLSRRTSWRIGGPVDLYVVAKTRDQLVGALDAGWKSETPVFLFGAGSNLLVRDGGIRGLVIENSTQEITVLDERTGERLLVRIESGMQMARAAYYFARKGWKGLEWAVGIPGTLGGAVVSNAGAHGGVMSDIARSVQLLTRDEGLTDLPAGDIGFGYRTSNLQRLRREGGMVPAILAVDVELTPEDPYVLQGLITSHSAYRKATQPAQPSSGSVFKNPPDNSAGRLIDQCGLKGYRIGDAQISEKHGNFIVNRGHALAAEVEQLIALARERVLDTFGIELESEIEMVGVRGVGEGKR